MQGLRSDGLKDNISEEILFNQTPGHLLVKAIRLATVVYKDPVGTDNAYRFIQYVNDAKEKTIFIADDDLSDGRRIGIAAIF